MAFVIECDNRNIVAETEEERNDLLAVLTKHNPDSNVEWYEARVCRDGSLSHMCSSDGHCIDCGQYFADSDMDS